MLKITQFIIVVALFCNGLPAFALDAPRLSVSTSDVSVSLSWSSIPGATGYTLYYAPYPYEGPETINSVEMGATTDFSATLWDGAAYYVAVTTRDGSSESGYSNIESFTIDVTEEDTDLASCGDQSTFYTVAPLDSQAFMSITPLGNLNPPDHTFPTVHTYMGLTDNTVSVPVYAPGDITITQITTSTVISSVSVSFYSCSEVWGYFNHMTTLSDEILDQLSEADLCNWTSIPENSLPYCVNIEVSAGTIVGTIGGPNSDGSAALDFGARDKRTDPISFINPERADSEKPYVVCPYDYYEDGLIKDGLMAKLQLERTDSPICGTVDLDIAETAQGLWYLSGSSSDMDESNHIALVPSNFDPSVGVLSIGNTDIGTEAYFFDMESTGLKLRDFSGVSSDGNMYCYDNLRTRTNSIASGNSASLSGHLFFNMPTNNTLKIERASTGSCPNNPNNLSFSSIALTFER